MLEPMPGTFVELFVPLDEFEHVHVRLPRLAEQALGWASGSAVGVRVCRQSLDARKGRPLGFRLRCQVARTAAELSVAVRVPRATLSWPADRQPPRVVVIGSGPAGSWAALRLVEGGVPVTIIERGKPVQPRRADWRS